MRSVPAVRHAFVLVAVVVLGLALATPASALTRRQANDIALRALKPQAAKGAVILFGLPKPLKASQSVVEASPDRLGNGPATGLPKLGRSTWLFWEDLDVSALFAHPSVLLLIDDASGRVVKRRTLDFYPLIDGRIPPFLVSDRAYFGPKYRVFSRLGAPARVALAAPEPAAPARPLTLPADAFANDCLLAVALVPAPRDPKKTAFAKNSTKALEGWLGLAGSMSMSGYQATASGPEQNKTDLNTTDEQVDGTSLGANVDKLVKDLNCKDVMLYILGHGIKDSAEPTIVVGQGKTITAADLEKIIKDHAPGKENPATFKLVIEACFSERFKDPLVDETNLKIITVSSKATQTTKGAMIKSQPKGTTREVANPGRPEFSHGMIEGIRKTIENDADTTQLQGQGDSFLARVIKAGFAKQKANNVADQAGLSTPIEMDNLPAGTAAKCSGSFLPFDQTEVYFRVSCEQLGASSTGRPSVPWAFAGQASRFDVQLPGNRRVTLYLSPPGFACSPQTRVTQSDTLRCVGTLVEGVAVTGNLRMSPGPAPGMGGSLYVLVGSAEAGPFPIVGP